ncbi:rRNA-processing protein bfr2 [Pseudocyphellaria aurata]|nr:rRNA-processing protein bfr2 [Pseudocyphellaria aurata]
MAPIARGRRSDATTTSSTGPTPLPPYQPLINSLTPEAQRALSEIPRTHRLDGLKKHLHQVTQSLTTVAGDVNDRYYKKLEVHRKRQARKQEKNEEDDDEASQALEEVRERVDKITGNVEESIRRTIDVKAAVDGVEAALRELSANIINGGGAVMPTQSTLGASQFRPGKRQRDPDADSQESDNQEDSTHPLGLFKRKMTEYNSNYQNVSMRHKYASNNDYIGFKKIVHDSRHPEDDARPLPHASTWFPGSPSANRTGDDQAAGGADDDDLEVASERISLNCPLTLLPMRDPVSSRKCPHSFERAAILELLSASHARSRGRNGLENAMKCPVCEVMLTPSDLYTDPILVRKIARIQAMARDSDSESEATLPRATQRPHHQEIDSDDEAGGAAARSSTKVKDERAASSKVSVVGGRRDREISMVPATQLEGTIPPSTGGTIIVDLEDEDEEEDGDEDEDEGEEGEEEEEQEEEEEDEEEEEEE